MESVCYVYIRWREYGDEGPYIDEALIKKKESEEHTPMFLPSLAVKKMTSANHHWKRMTLTLMPAVSPPQTPKT